MNKITKNLNVAQGSDRSAGRKYGLDWNAYQATGGYKAQPNHRHKEMSDKALENSYQRKIGTFGDPVRNAAKIDVAQGSWNRGGMRK